MRRLLFVIPLLFLLTGSAAPPSDPDLTIREIPDHTRILQGPLPWQKLIDAAQPTLILPNGSFLWTRKDGKGNRIFELNTPHQLTSNNKTERQYVLLAASREVMEETFAPTRAIVSINKKLAPDNPEPAPDKSYATVLSVHPKFGTLYQIGWCRSMGFNYYETRLYVMHGPDHGWRFVGQIEGARESNVRSRCFWASLSQTVTWTGKPDAPVILRLTASDGEGEVTEEGQSPDPPDLETYQDYLMEGPLPITPRPIDHPYVLSAKGDTLESALKPYLVWQTVNFPADTAKKHTTLLITVELLNPNLPAKLRSHTRINLPYPDEIVQIAEPAPVAQTQPAPR